jgi:hypothetical protein
MARKFDCTVDFVNHPWLNAVLETIAGNPGSTSVDGRIWYDSTNHTVKVRLFGVTTDLRDLGSMTGSLTAANISDFTAAVQAIRWASMLPPNASVNMNSQQFSGLATATTGGQAVEYAQFQAALSNIQVGMDFKEHAEIAALVNTSVAAPGGTINGRTMVAGDRVLLTNQTSHVQDGLWQWNGAAVPMTRPADSPTGNTSAIVAGTVVEAYNGTSRTLFMQTATGTGTNGAIVVDTDAQTWIAPFSLSIAAGYGVTVTGGNKVGFNPGLGMAAVGADGATAGIDPAVVERHVMGVVPTATTGIFTVGATDSGGSGFIAVTVNHALNNLCPSLTIRYGSAGADPGQQLEVDNKPPSAGTDANNLVFNLPNGYVANAYRVKVSG